MQAFDRGDVRGAYFHTEAAAQHDLMADLIEAMELNASGQAAAVDSPA
ncbi:hypothetical protein BH20ACT2_BH20ACT2_05840 [soil metagenome]